MSGKEHTYGVKIRWTGNRGAGTAEYAGYDRTHEIEGPGKPVIPGSSDPFFLGSRERYNPEDMLVASLSSCHMLWYLHLCAASGVVVEEYVDDAHGTMMEDRATGGRFTEVVLQPTVTISSGNPALAESLHEKAHHFCYVANSVNFPVRCKPTIRSTA